MYYINDEALKINNIKNKLRKIQFFQMLTSELSLEYKQEKIRDINMDDLSPSIVDEQEMFVESSHGIYQGLSPPSGSPLHCEGSFRNEEANEKPVNVELIFHSSSSSHGQQEQTFNQFQYHQPSPSQPA